MQEVLNTTELLAIPALPLIAALIVGLFGWALKETLSHTITTASVIASAALSIHVFTQVLDGSSYYGNFWEWMISGSFKVPVGMMIDQLTAIMMITVTIVSACVHIYTIGYMHGDPGYSRFFAYISGFTFSMLVLVMGNNFFTLFFGWEAVGLVSYLLIGFWFKRESANFASLKAFIVNRVGDFGFAVGILAIWYYFGTIDYREVFDHVETFVAQGHMLSFMGWQMDAITFICLALFVGAMGKSGQVPLHVWLPDSMEGPTPISALIHAATMVTAGVFMVARCSPMFEFSETALAAVTLVGAITAWMCATIGLVQNDIKRVIAYSTCSQLGYMFVACGVSAYSVGIFHLMTHAYFKALLFLAAGSVIHAVMAEQDIRKMGQLRKYMPVTYITMLIAALALSGIPPFAGYWSKDLIIEAAAVTEMGWIGQFAYFAVLSGVFMTAFYTFRMFFLTFHNSDRVPEEIKPHVHESPWVITLPLCILAVGALAAGYWGANVLHMPGVGNEVQGFFGTSIFVLEVHDPLLRLEEMEHAGSIGLMIEFGPLMLALSGIGLAVLMYLRKTSMPKSLAKAAGPLYTFLLNKWYWDELYAKVFMRPAQCLGNWLWQKADLAMIDRGILHGMIVDSVASGALRFRAMQTGMVYHYAYVMVIGVFGLLTWLLLKA
ncbi:MAG: NADH-quinone oxidoreductase subunit L [Zetaproteobacteria bacterium CG_4_9_14_3_um_filter_49_83]|nr:MAG: NADH-quinone oxidoreductase subunit L [Zetaproteobacteria bacterium CG1_02_49_23]PIQ30482.1 MAG: NADH-quinone oxidoreductase subunit L [Zetaproteobacteria bacterium CG17_big_fil_post_rev_8_21_14_2_50_50_13]PIV31595.1 MAG: NADH-quinone oxidoreductase subunit L [Zetaproteobacteria bacterium CG02_land_8_20_14_3_00_50_9]PIY55264.1 MAG: NADH-quinone oxidoreductase subunit L [Zetaproteobacteria bacterium CG_4_10_14_0_8_um_filter_49_80]PJA36076.1 MAG: NADH-quinone oxidoreductase subunit L [Zet